MNDRIASENGDNLVLQNVKGSKMNALTVYGNSTQDATPSPENPVPIVSAGDEGEINVSVSDGGTQSQTLTLSTPGGLPGIPVTSDGNYTDESGQQWICDEIDLKRGKYVQRIEKEVIGDNASFALNHANVGKRIVLSDILNSIGVNTPNDIGAIMSSAFKAVSDNQTYTNVTGISVETTGAITLYSESIQTIEQAQSYFEERPMTVIYALIAPIETDLPAEEIDAYKALHTYSPNTTVSNDAEAWMKVGYREWRR